MDRPASVVDTGSRSRDKRSLSPMPELAPLPFATLLRRMLAELKRDARIFDLPAAKFWRGDGNPRPRTGVRFCGLPAGTPLGPAAGPHTQMAQNLVLCWLGGARILELKTVQVDDRLTIGRPCIDMTNVGYNIEFSQELLVRQSLDEYVKGWMLIRILEESGALGVPGRERPTGPAEAPHFYDTVFDLSCGYDLAGIRGGKVQGFIRGLQDASETIERLRGEIPQDLKRFRDLEFDPHIVSTATLSTFHNCPADEIEGIVDHLLRHNRLHTIIKMNPTMLGGERIREILHGTMGYGEITVNPAALTAGLQFDDSIEMTRRLRATGRALGLDVGAKFSNTLEVLNHREFFGKNEKVMYLSGAPLHPITQELGSVWRDAYRERCGGGDDDGIPDISFSAGVDRHNFADCVACGFVPVTVCTDLLKPGGYTRMVEYLDALDQAMKETDAGSMAEFIVHRAGGDKDPRRAALDNHRRAAAAAVADTRYSRSRNSLVPKRINSKLWVFDCISCDKCVPVCPNDANFVFDLPRQEIAYRNYVLRGGRAEAEAGGVLRITKPHQIANFAPFCNECGNCDTFCPEYGGPFIEKPSFFHLHGQWEEFRGYDGFHIRRMLERDMIFGRMKGLDFVLTTPPGKPETGRHLFECPAGKVAVDAETLEIAEVLDVRENGGQVDINVYLTLRLLLRGVLYSRHVNYVNAAYEDLVTDTD